MKQIIFVSLMAAAVILPAAEHEKSIYRAHKVSPYVVRITCENGADATVITDPRLRQIIGSDGLLVSCGDLRHPITLQSK